MLLLLLQSREEERALTEKAALKTRSSCVYERCRPSVPIACGKFTAVGWLNFSAGVNIGYNAKMQLKRHC